MGLNDTRGYPGLVLLVLHPVSSGGRSAYAEVWYQDSVRILAAGHGSVLPDDPAGSQLPLRGPHRSTLHPGHRLCKSLLFILSRGFKSGVQVPNVL